MIGCIPEGRIVGLGPLEVEVERILPGEPDPAVDLESVEMLSKTMDAEEGVRAFIEKRDPVFKGK